MIKLHLFVMIGFLLNGIYGQWDGVKIDDRVWWQQDLGDRQVVTAVAAVNPDMDFIYRYLPTFMITIDDKDGRISPCAIFDNKTDQSGPVLRLPMNCKVPVAGQLLSVRQGNTEPVRAVSFEKFQVSSSKFSDERAAGKAVTVPVPDNTHPAGDAVDNTTRTCAFTTTRGSTAEAYLQVDLQQNYKITTVDIIASKLDTDGALNEQFQVLVSSTSAYSSGQECLKYQEKSTSGPGSNFNFNVGGSCGSNAPVGRFVTIRRMNTAGGIAICDIRVIGEYAGPLYTPPSNTGNTGSSGNTGDTGSSGNTNTPDTGAKGGDGAAQIRISWTLIAALTSVLSLMNFLR